MPFDQISPFLSETFCECFVKKCKVKLANWIYRYFLYMLNSQYTVHVKVIKIITFFNCLWIFLLYWFFTESSKEESKHKDNTGRTQPFRKNRMKVSTSIPTVEDIATIKHKKKVYSHKYYTCYIVFEEITLYMNPI